MLDSVLDTDEVALPVNDCENVADDDSSDVSVPTVLDTVLSNEGDAL